jgi:DNA-binding winged helix-turn-helix (wHTH) protein
MNFKYLSIVIVAALLVVFYAVRASQLNDTDFAAAKELIVMRKIGHEVLLHSGDSTSRVLPVQQVAANEYQIRFESQFTFKPDSLVKIIQRTLNAHQLPSDYIVNVIECASNEKVFGYAMLQAEEKNIIPCIGRQQAKGCYSINISFQNNSLLSLPGKYVTAGIGLFALVAVFAGVKIYNKKKSLPAKGDNSIEDNFIPIGKYQFYNDKQYLIINNEQIKLTQKEAKLLFIFASAPNEIIDRNRLQKEIWEDEGVIVGRSLDVFISKLRKKLENDSTVKVVNIHGKGYKLEISS